VILITYLSPEFVQFNYMYTTLPVNEQRIENAQSFQAVEPDHGAGMNLGTDF